MAPQSRLHGALVGTLLAGIVALGVYLRLRDPMSSPAIGAEDPYTHLVFMKEILANGFFADSRWLGTGLYPPGLHALGVSLVGASGVDLYWFVLWAPVGFGVLAILGMYVLGERLLSPSAGLAAALVVALMPEHIFRSELFFPTALDLAVLPALLLAFHLAADLDGQGKPDAAAIAFFLLLVPPLAFAHPWAVPLFLVPGLAYAGLRVLRTATGAREAARRMLLPAGLVVVACAFAMASRWDKSDTGFSGFLEYLGPLGALSDLQLPALLLFAVLAAILATLCVPGIALVAAGAEARARLPRLARFGVGLACAAALLASIPFLVKDLGPDVGYRYMLGWSAIGLCVVGLVLACVRGSPLGDLGLCLTVFLFPLTAVNIFDSPFWPQRTVVYLALGVALLAGVAVSFAAGQFLRLARTGRQMRVAMPAAALASVMLVSTAFAAAPASTYEWYRLYTDEEFAILQELADLLAEDPSAQAVVYSWQPGLFLKALGDPAQVRYSPSFFKDASSARTKILAEDHDHLYVMADKYLAKDANKGKVSPGFLEDGSKYRPILQSRDGALVVYEVVR